MDTPTNLANHFKVGLALDQSRSVQSRWPERMHQNNKQKSILNGLFDTDLHSVSWT